MVNRWAGGLIILLLMGLLTYMAVPGFTAFRDTPVSVDEVLESRNPGGKKMVVQGIVDGQSIYHEPGRGIMRFRLKSESERTMKVNYTGPVPKELIGGTGVTMEGIYTMEQVFVAERIWTNKIKRDHYRR